MATRGKSLSNLARPRVVDQLADDINALLIARDTSAAEDMAALMLALSMLLVGVCQAKKWELGPLLDTVCERLRTGAAALQLGVMVDDAPAKAAPRRRKARPL